MVKRLDLNKWYTTRQVLKLQLAGYEQERSLYPKLAIPALELTEDGIRSSKEIYLGFVKRIRILGLVGYRRKSSHVEITRLMVDERHWKQGIGKSLLMSLEAREPQAKFFQVYAAQANVKALNLYGKIGYHSAGRIQPIPGLILERLEKRRD